MQRQLKIYMIKYFLNVEKERKAERKWEKKEEERKGKKQTSHTHEHVFLTFTHIHVCVKKYWANLVQKVAVVSVVVRPKQGFKWSVLL